MQVGFHTAFRSFKFVAFRVFVSRIGEDVSHSKARVCPVETREGHP